MKALVTGGTGQIGPPSPDGSSATAGRCSLPDAPTATSDRRRRTNARRDCVRASRRLDLLVNAAGEGFVPKPVEEVEEADWDAALGATAKGTFFVTQAAAPLLRESRGVVVMIEDVAAYQPWPSFAAHCAAKAAQAMLTRVFARALAPEVRVCGIAPEPIAVGPDQVERLAAKTLVGRIGTPTRSPVQLSSSPTRISSRERRSSSTAASCSNPCAPRFRRS